MTKIRIVASIALALASSDLAHAQSLRGSRASVDRMFTRAVRNELDFLRTSKSIYEAVKDGELVMLSISSDLTMDDVGYPFVLPRTRDVVNTFARKYREACGERVTITSASRPRAEQPRNASPKSVHPTGMAVDFRRPTGNCLTWMRSELVLLERQGVLEATEEKHPVHFHVAVLQRGRFAPAAPAIAASAVSTSPAVAVANAVAEAVATATADGAVLTGDDDHNDRLTANPASEPLAVESPPEPAAAGSKTSSASKPAGVPSNATTYTVRKGDNLSVIGKKFGVTTAQLRSLNGLKTSAIRPGQKLRVK